MLSNLPVLYSLQHCPYAMRARIAIFKSQQPILIRAIKLNNKPPEMLTLSTKGTVPMLVLNGNEVIEESLDIMLKVLKDNDPSHLLSSQGEEPLSDIIAIIDEFEQHFFVAVEAYKCAKRYQENNIVECRRACEVYLQKLEDRLSKHAFLASEREGLLDIALMPFVRQFSKVERQWYQQSPYPKLRAWLSGYLQSTMFTKVMAKHELWVDGHQDIVFGDIKK
ncbi:glutathione S-transferase [Psychromonas sp. 14N.309.X.WAT.B.A12]|uniref:glutathione S-transferase n=1 Tax=Psychromonas sp. 14N.309.X.WAT.B.A12 TaxID=2998322 RepID=UPI0025B06510|nr:glutathione S-transferase [Psychromonas sp. 14N.309.X.WAT.B.A12]MDN2664949.1 glutathione S-transferase [Psychromonas sp. 14N.309.X.WAT.B.A12]